MVMAEEENMTVIRSPLIAAGLDVLRLDLRYRDRHLIRPAGSGRLGDPQHGLARGDLAAPAEGLPVERPGQRYRLRRVLIVQPVERPAGRSEETTYELQSLIRNSY